MTGTTINGSTSNGSKVVQIEPKELQSKGFFVNLGEKIKPESDNSGSIENHLDSRLESGKNGEFAIPILPDVPNLYKHNGTSVENSRFIKFIPGQASDWLQENHPNAFLLLCLIAKRARRFNGHIDGLEIGMAHLGDYKKAGIETQSKYRTAKEVLIRLGIIRVVETLRRAEASRSKIKKNTTKHENSTTQITTRTTTKGTLVILLKSDIWDINPVSDNDSNHDSNHDSITTRSRLDHDEQESKEVKKVSSNSTMSDSQAHPTRVERIFFNWQIGKLEGITKEDITEWQKAFPHVNVPEYLKFIELDIGAKPTKYSKRKQIAKTVIIYLKNKNENESAYKARAPQHNGYQKPQPKYNHDTSPSNPKNHISFAEEV